MHGLKAEQYMAVKKPKCSTSALYSFHGNAAHGAKALGETFCVLNNLCHIYV